MTAPLPPEVLAEGERLAAEVERLNKAWQSEGGSWTIALSAKARFKSWVWANRTALLATARRVGELEAERDAALKTLEMSSTSGGFHAAHAANATARAEASEAREAKLREAIVSARDLLRQAGGCNDPRTLVSKALVALDEGCDALGRTE